MAVAGRKAKPEAINRHPLTVGWIEVPDVPYSGPRPELGPIGGRQRWPKRTLDWWERLSAMPHCVLWTDSDWQLALDTAVVHALFIKTGRGAGELRMRMQRMGATVEDRRANHIRYVNPLAGLTVPDDEDDAQGEDEGDGDESAAVDFEARRRRRLLEAAE